MRLRKISVFLNSDTLLLNNAIRIIFDYAESHQHEKIGTLGSWLLDKKETPTTLSAFSHVQQTKLIICSVNISYQPQMT